MWIFRNKSITSLEDIEKLQLENNPIGFVYEVVHIPTEKKYIGKKVLKHKKTLPPLKNKKRKRKVVKESDWLTYYGSNELILEYVKNGEPSENFKREILQFCYTLRQLTYYEVFWQFKKDVLKNDNYLNGTILGKFYKKDI